MSDPVTATAIANANAPASTADTSLNDVVDSVAAEAAPQKDTADQGPPFDVKALTDRALQFLATASNETLGACLVGLGAGTYLILGRVGLVLIGVVGGVVLHSTWEGQLHGGEGQEKGKSSDTRKRELGADVARRILDWRGNKDKQDRDTDDSDLSLKLCSGKALDYSEFKPETAAALTELTDAVIRDYVKYVLGTLPTNLSNTVQMVVLTHSACRRSVPQLVPPNTYCFHAFCLRTPLSQTACRQLRRFRDTFVLLHDHPAPGAFERYHGFSWRCPGRSSRPLPQDEARQHAREHPRSRVPDTAIQCRS
jgi:hypothetical protein